MTKTGARLWCEVRARVVSIDDDGFMLLEGLTQDVSERKRFERDLAMLRDLQRQEMAQQLHDELGQDLLGLRLLSESLRRTLAAAGNPAAGTARELAEAATQTQDRVRQIIKGIRPVEVAPSGLMEALADLASNTERLTDIPCSFECSERVAVEDSHSATELFHIAQEAVRNAVRHAGPSGIRIGLGTDNGQLVLSVARRRLGPQR